VRDGFATGDGVVTDPRREALDATGARFEVRVLEPSPPAVLDPPFLADDPAAPGEPADGHPLLLPVAAGDLTWDELARAEPDLADFCADRWLGAWRTLTPVNDVDALAATRASLHAVAEQVVATARRRANGKIGLRFTRHGFGTPFYRNNGPDTQVRVEDGDLVVVRGDDGVREPITTLADAGRLAGVIPGAADDLYAPQTSVDADAHLTVDRASARLLGDWYGFACSVLEQLRVERQAWGTRAQLWPEHFDLSIDLGDEPTDHRGTFGGSPGDAEHPLPYLYVTHWAPVVDNPYWNDDAFGGASLDYDALAGRADARAAALEFLRAGLEVLGP
jgi:hypothetical protein